MSQQQRSILNVSASALFLWISAGLAAAQSVPAAQGPPAEPPPSGEFFETVDVDVVNVEVFVTDKKGHPVEGLTASDFEVLEDGEPVEITNFYAARAAPPTAAAVDGATAAAPAPAAPPAEEVPEDQRLNMVILVDNHNVRPQSRNRVLRAFTQSLDSQIRAGDRVLVATYDGSVNIRQNLTDDRPAVVAALDGIAEETPGGVQAMMDRVAILRELQQIDLEEVADLVAPPTGFRMGGTTDWQGIYQSIRTYAERQYQEIERTTSAMRSFVDSLAGLKGRKALVYVSDGLSLRPGEALFMAWETKRSEGAAGPGDANVQAESREFDASPLFEELGRHANANQVTFYTILAGGGQGESLTPAERSAFFSLNQPTTLGQVWNDQLETVETSNLRGSMQILAEATGGLATVSTLDFRGALGRLQRDFETYYSLGYRPPRPDEHGDRKIKVRAKDKSLVVRHRETYRARSADERMTSHTLAALLYEVGDNPLGVVVDFGEEKPGEKGRLLVPVMVKFPIAKLLLVPQERFHEGRVSIYVAARDKEGRMSPVQQMPAPVRIPNDKLVTALGQVAGYRMTLMLRPEEHEVVVGVRDELANVESVARVSHTPGSHAESGS